MALAPAQQKQARDAAIARVERVAHRLRNAAAAALGKDASVEAIATFASGLATLMSGDLFTAEELSAFAAPDDR